MNTLSLVLVLPALAQASDLVSYWELDESSGTHTVNPMGMTVDPLTGLIEWTPMVTDSFGVTVEAINTEGIHTQSFSVTVAPAVLPPAENHLEFDGSNDYVEIGDSGDLDLTGGSFTLAAWIKPSGWGQNRQGRIMDHGGGRKGNAGWSLHVDNKSVSGALRLQVNNDFSFNGASEANVISLDKRQHVAVTVESGTLTFYVDGVEQGIRTGVPAPIQRGDPVRIGMRATDTKRTFAGAIDEVQIWDRALSQAEIQATMNEELTGSEAGLVGYYQLNEGTGQTVTDSSGHGHDGRLGSSTGVDGNDPTWVSTGPLNQVPGVNAESDQTIVSPADVDDSDSMMIYLPLVHKSPISPYPPSSMIMDISFDWSSYERRAPGSDNWPITWADNDHQYTAWGDGGGFGSTSGDGRVSLGVARIEGSWNNYTGHNVWGGKNTENPAQFGGKSYGIVSIDGVLYMWVSPGSDNANYNEARLAKSTDHGATWIRADWAFTQADKLVLPTFAQFGKDYAGARDNYVYSYAIRLEDGSSLKVQKPGQIDLMRVPNDRIMERAAYEFFAGLNGNGNPTWTNDLATRVPVLEDPNGVGWNVSVSYNPGLGRYLLATEHTESFQGNVGIFDGLEPWGPWTTVLYERAFGSPEIEASTFFWNFSNKWLSADGKNFSLIFTGIGENDSWNTVRGSFISR